MSSVAEHDPLPPSTAKQVRPQVSAVLGSLAERSRGASARLFLNGRRSSKALLRSSLSISRSAGSSIAAHTRDGLKISASLTTSLLGHSRVAGRHVAAGYLAFETFCVDKAAPWLLHRSVALGRRLRPSRLDRDRRTLLLPVHEHLFGREIESLLFVPTYGAARKKGPDSTAIAVGATPRRVFEWAMEAIPEPLDHFVFVQVGAGLGRDLLLASELPFERVIGVEPDVGLHGDCHMNLSQYPRSRMKCRDVDCLNEDTLPVPAQQAVYYLFNPSDEALVTKTMERIASAYARNPRRFYLVAVGLRDAKPIDATPILERVRISRRLRAKMTMLSPYPVILYRSLA